MGRGIARRGEVRRPCVWCASCVCAVKSSRLKLEGKWFRMRRAWRRRRAVENLEGRLEMGDGASFTRDLGERVMAGGYG